MEKLTEPLTSEKRYAMKATEIYLRAQHAWNKLFAEKFANEFIEGFEKEFARWEDNKNKEIAVDMYRKDIDMEIIANVLDLSLEEVEKMLRWISPRPADARRVPCDEKDAIATSLSDEKKKGLAGGEAKGKAEGLAEGKAEATREMVIGMHRRGIDKHVIAEISYLPHEEVKQILADTK